MDGESAREERMPEVGARPTPLDEIARDLQLLRVRAGGVSYAEISARIARLRESRGLPPERARVARSSVFDAFREGRARLNADLVADIALALGEDEAAADTWRTRVAAAHLPSPSAPAPDDPAPARQDPAPVRAETPSDGERWLRRALIVTLLAGSVFLNISGTAIAVRFDSPIFLDMIGTALSAIVLGPWHGAAVGVVTNMLGSLATSPETILFALVNVAGALVWGYGIRRIGRSHPFLRFTGLSLLAGLVCILVSIPVNVVLYGEISGPGTDPWIDGLMALGGGMWAAIALANIAASLLDKLLAGYLALAVAIWLAPVRLRSDIPEPTSPFRRRRP